MTSHEQSWLDEKLKTMKKDVNWNSSRQQKVKSNNRLKMTLEKQKPFQKKRRRAIFPTFAMAMVISLSIILLVNTERLEEENLTHSDAEYNDIVIQQHLPYEINGESKSEITEIVDLGFQLNLPQVSLVHSKTDRVEMNYIFKNDKEFSIIQEPLEGFDEQNVAHRQQKENAVGKEQVNGRSIFVLENGHNVSLYLLTEQGGFRLQSTDLSLEQMVEIERIIGINNDENWKID